MSITGCALNMSGVVLNTTEFVVNITGIVLNVAGLVLNETEFVPNVSGFVKNMTGSLLKKSHDLITIRLVVSQILPYLL